MSGMTEQKNRVKTHGLRQQCGYCEGKGEGRVGGGGGGYSGDK